MRGCLSVLVLALVVALVGLWFGGPPIAAGLVSAGLGSAGVRSDDLEVSVQADPPLELALGRADRVIVTGTDVDVKDNHADTLRLTLDDVDLLGRSAARTTGELTGVELPGVDPRGSRATVEIAGRGPTATVTITFDGATAEAMAAAAFEQATGVRPSRTTLRAPDVIRFTAGAIDGSGTIKVDPDGSLAVTTPQGTVTILEAGATDPIRLTDVAVQGDDLVLTGSVDVAGLLQ